MATKPRTPTIPLTEIEHAAFCRPEDELPAKSLAEELAVNIRWQRIPPEYLRCSPEELDERIYQVRQNLGTDVTILGHHYQREEIIKYADFQGDSFLLSQEAASRPEAEYIVFAACTFMAETACILCAPTRRLSCPTSPPVVPWRTWPQWRTWRTPGTTCRTFWADHGGIIPVTYMNSIAGIKALCGRNNGAVCTSSNATAGCWNGPSRSPAGPVPARPAPGPQHGPEAGHPPGQMVVWNPFKRLGGNTPEQLRNAKMVLWQGHCSVHTRFTPAQVKSARERYPDVNVLVHPECPMETLQAADMNGSTEFIRKAINEAPAGSQWAVGTEISLVNRLALQNPDKTVFCLDPVSCPCSTMYRIHPAYLLWVLEGLAEGVVNNQITVPEDVRRDANIALERMLALR